MTNQGKHTITRTQNSYETIKKEIFWLEQLLIRVGIILYYHSFFSFLLLHIKLYFNQQEDSHQILSGVICVR